MKEYTASCTKMSNYLCKKGSYFFLYVGWAAGPWGENSDKTGPVFASRCRGLFDNLFLQC